MDVYLNILLTVFLFQGVHGAQWTSLSPPDGHVIYACEGDNVTIPWEYLLSTGDAHGDTHWFYDGHSQEMVAMSTHGNFLVMPAFSTRVTADGNAGISIRKVVAGDSGNYSVEVHVYADSGASHLLLRRHVLLQISAQLMTTDGVLHASQSSEAVFDQGSGQWVIELKCGTFTFLDGNPPFHVEWTSPSGRTYDSNSFSNGHFILLLQSPEGGSYTCRIPPQQAHHACLRNVHRGEATVNLDKTDARLSLLEKENQQLRSQLQQMNTAVSSLSTDTHTRLGKLEDATSHPVAFHAYGPVPDNPASGTPFLFKIVVFNAGSTYDPATGWFTAPYAGVYFFAAKTSAGRDEEDGYHYLMVDGTTIDGAYTNNPSEPGGTSQAPLHGVVHLNAGQRVWVSSNGIHYWGGNKSSFSGFLLSHDP